MCLTRNILHIINIYIYINVHVILTKNISTIMKIMKMLMQFLFFNRFFLSILIDTTEIEKQ